ncbi:MAG: hypothetical protein R3C39_08485 [Dehalococcoidia bacterium]
MAGLRARRASWTMLLVALASGVVALEASRAPAESADGLAFPAPAGSTWHIASGYNTATHTGTDPYAIDVVRDDAETAGTPVLSPIDGTIRYVADDCLSVRDGADVSILLCHVFPLPGLDRGTPVSRGQRIATVAPAGQANNNGLAHIHIAAHYGSTRNFGSTVPLAGAYAIEGVQLPPSTAANAYSGRTFRSTNSASSGNVSFVPQTQTEPAAQGDAALLSGFNARGASLVATLAPLPTPNLLASMRAAGGAGCTVSSIVAGSWVAYIDGAPSTVNARWEAAFPSALPAYTPLFTRCR